MGDGLLGHGQTLPGDHRLIDLGLAVLDGAVDPNADPIEADINQAAAFQTAYTMLENRPPFFEFPVKAAMLSAFGALVQNGVSARISASKRAAADSIKAAIAFIQENYRSAVSVQQLAHAAGMSEGHFCRVFKQYTLKTPVQFINGVRLSHALELLTATNLRVLDIAMDCGFNSMSYFIEVFRTEYDATPLQYRKKLEEIKVPK